MKVRRLILFLKSSGRIALLVILTTLGTFSSAKATSYYFSSSSGDDSRSAVQAQSPLTPWKTIGKLNTVFNFLQPGDSVLFKKGETFFGAIVINKSGTSDSPIVFSSYGVGNKPVITSLVKLSTWMPVENGIWVCYHPALGREVNMVLLDSVMQPMGRYPNGDSENKGYLTIDSFDSKLSITDHELSATPNWTGAEVVIRKNRWALDRNVVKTHAGTTISYISSSAYEPKAGFGYFIQNHIQTLDQFGEWYYNPYSRKMYVYFGAKASSSYLVEAATIDNLVYSYNRSHIIFHDLTFRGGNKDTFRIREGGNISINSCDIQFSGKNGIRASKHASITIENNHISNSNSTGINLSSNNLYAIIRNNSIENSGLLPGMGEKDGSLSIGIQCYSEGAVVDNNKVLNSGYNGIAIKLNSTTIKNNYIRNFCSIKDDGGGIYSHNGSNKVLAGALISGNIIENGIGAPEGTDSFISNAEGIYMDDNSSAVEIRDNTVANCHRGIYFHNAGNMLVVKNTFFNNDVQFYAKHDKLGNPIRDLTVNNNIFFSKLPTQLVFQVETRLNDIGRMGNFDHNYYARPLDDGIMFYNSFKTSEGRKVKKLLDLEGWKAAYKKDLNSKKSPAPISSYALNRIVGLNKYASGMFTNKEIKVFGNKCLLDWSNEKKLDGGHLVVTPSDDDSSITMNVGSLDPAKIYILRYSVMGDGRMNIGAFLRYGGSPYKPITPIIYRKISTLRSDYEMMLIPSVSQHPGTLVFTVDQAYTYYLDNIQLYEADVTITEPDDYIRFEYNATAKSRRVALNGSYIDVQNNNYSNALELSPFSSIILLKQTGNPGNAQGE